MYLSKVIIKNFRGIKELEVNFNKDINIIIGENGSGKTALIDAIRLLYSLGEQQRTIWISKEDFYCDIVTGEICETISFEYEFKGLSDKQKGALYEYLVLNDTEDFARLKLTYSEKNKKVRFEYSAGEVEGQKPDTNTFELFQHYYLSALRDSTRDLLMPKQNILGQLIQRVAERENKHTELEDLIKGANSELLKSAQVTKARDGINSHLVTIFGNIIENKIGVNIEPAKIDRIVSIIKPFLPHDKNTLEGDGFSLGQNSLGFNNLIYIATILGDIEDQLKNDNLSHYALLIEEPEAHLHPQLQMGLFKFLSANSKSPNSQLFITTHSPTLTSKVPLNNLIVLNDVACPLGEIFNRDNIEGEDIEKRKKQLERYLDVTRSQLFYSKGILLVEGVSEELLVPIMSIYHGKDIVDSKFEIVNVQGTSFYPFLYLFNSESKGCRLELPVGVMTDDDRFTVIKKEYSFSKIISDDTKLEELYNNIQNGKPDSRLDNLKNVRNKQDRIQIEASYQTFELALISENVSLEKKDFYQNGLMNFFEKNYSEEFKQIKEKVDNLQVSSDGKFEEKDRKKIALLLWRLIAVKSEFAQDLSIYLLENLTADPKLPFNPPKYFTELIDHLVSYEPTTKEDVQAE